MSIPVRNRSLHGNAPENSAAALLIVDVMQRMDFRGAERLLRAALPVARRIAKLKKRAKAASIPTIYVNDNVGRWRSDSHHVVSAALEEDSPGYAFSSILAPDADDYFMLKPKQSGFFGTTLDTLLRYLQAKHLIITGVSADICVKFTAMDAFMRDYGLLIPRDCVASDSTAKTARALSYMKEVLAADLTPSPRLALARLARDPGT